MDLYKNVEILKYNGDNYKTVTDKVITEAEYKLFINGKKEDMFYCSPDNLREMVTGYLFKESLIKTVNNITSLSIDINRIKVEIRDGNKINIDVNTEDKLKIEDIDITPTEVFRIVKTLTRNSKLFRETGGVHNVLLCTANAKKIIFREDVSRNNAVNKVIGNILINRVKPFDKVIAVSCRVSGEIMGKIIKIGIPVVLSVSAPTDKAVKLAIDAGITLIGFVRGERMNVYSGNLKNKKINL